MAIKEYLTSFRGKLYLLVASAILLPLIISSFLLGSMLERQLSESFQNRLEAGLETFSLILKHKEDALIQGVSGMVSDNTLQLTLDLGIIPQLRKYLQTQSEVLGFSALTVTDSEKLPVASTVMALSEFMGNDTSELIADGTETLISYTRPIYRDDELLGYVIGAVSLTEVSFLTHLRERLVDNFSLCTGGEHIVTDLKPNALPPEWEHMTTRDMHEFLHSSVNYKIVSESILYGTRELTYSVLFPVAEQEKEFWTMVGIISAVVLFLFGSILTLLRRFMRQLIIPVTQLTKAASNIEEGEEIPYLDTQRTDEFGQLSVAFIRMVENLKDSEQELRNHRDHLKELVAERTVDLGKTNEELKQEITERKRVEEALKESNIRLEEALDNLEIERRQLLLMFDGMDEVIYASDPETHEILYMNSSARKHWGEGVGQKCYSVLQDLDSPCPFCTNHLIFGENIGKPYIWEFQNTINGRWYRCIDRAIRWSDGRMVRFEMAIDITEHRRAEEELQKVERLESIGLLAGGIAHDLNNFLTAIVGNIALARMYDDPDEKNRRALEAEKAAMQVKSLTQQLLTFSKGGAPIKELATIGKGLKQSVTFALRGSNVRCKFSIPDDLWPAEVDEGQINQVINNLIINAAQAMPKGGTIKASAKNMIVLPEQGLPLDPGSIYKDIL